MNKNNFEFVAILILALSLIYVPTLYCPGQCIQRGWQVIFDIAGADRIDFGKLLIQTVFVSLVLFAYWTLKYRK